MQLDKDRFKLLLAKWIRWDADLWGNLREIQVKILFERIIEEKSYQDLAVIYKTSPTKMHQIFKAILMKIEKHISKGIALLLSDINQSVGNKKESVKVTGARFRFDTIYLN